MLAYPTPTGSPAPQSLPLQPTTAVATPTLPTFATTWPSAAAALHLPDPSAALHAFASTATAHFSSPTTPCTTPSSQLTYLAGLAALFLAPLQRAVSAVLADAEKVIGPVVTAGEVPTVNVGMADWAVPNVPAIWPHPLARVLAAEAALVWCPGVQADLSTLLAIRCALLASVCATPTSAESEVVASILCAAHGTSPLAPRVLAPALAQLTKRAVHVHDGPRMETFGGSGGVGNPLVVAIVDRDVPVVAVRRVGPHPCAAGARARRMRSRDEFEVDSMSENDEDEAVDVRERPVGWTASKRMRKEV
ncbi:hypothetical protein AMAG_15533 [Allomyces macrogynus ATCC 38327]|uniref:Uncharacterized protein n=1 Tax=Allomyces macrogynus (strain ATCC 38327) TaxID=578462 RepID=A0A0L0T964_ALLM3|nr:hypothetical protein AMAG_15533 [Allomyces macrogynus ATCC 38327]|eukprot:KNE71292.1 hypothetical protein AMAG_15533 [Allomyces macrogynus ATCC 38327]